MKFCETCDNSLVFKEVRDIQNKIFKIVYLCETCNTQVPCENTCVYKKEYKKTESISYDDTFLNRYKTRDPSMPTRRNTCPHCKEENENAYYVKHRNNTFNIIFICSGCNQNYNFD